MTSWGTIAIGTRMNDRCDPVFFNCWSHMIARGLRKGDTVLDAGIELPQHFAAVVLVDHFLKSDADTLFMVDTDMIFKPEQLAQMRDDVDGHEYDVLSALSVVRRSPYLPIVLRLRRNPKPDQSAYVTMKPGPKDRIIDVDTVGTGFTLIRRTVFERMKAELGIDKWYFDFGQGGLGEDTMFSQRARGLNCRLGVHTKVSIGHRGPISFVWDEEKQMTMMESFNQIRDILTRSKK